MNKLKSIMASVMRLTIMLTLMVFLISTVYAYEIDIWKYTITYNPIIEEEIPTFTETHIFDEYVNEYNKLERINGIVAKIGYERIGLLNTDNNFIYTVYLNEQGRIIKVADGFDNVDFTAKLSINGIESLSKQQRFEDLPQEIKIPFGVKLRILTTLWLN